MTDAERVELAIRRVTGQLKQGRDGSDDRLIEVLDAIADALCQHPMSQKGDPTSEIMYVD